MVRAGEAEARAGSVATADGMGVDRNSLATGVTPTDGVVALGDGVSNGVGFDVALQAEAATIAISKTTAPGLCIGISVLHCGERAHLGAPQLVDL